ncbi:MAG: hypothetical protein TU35_002050 [Thermoproteus sp. AZ2]|uniref:Uncharacterized protein n=1 Tax=Thermoproteus sp. AZ2 TaxID=1609232 RepID=A0ACC6UZZ2_9CREN
MLEKFFLENIPKILEYLDQDVLVIYSKRTVDALVASYFLMEKFAGTAVVKVVDWPPESGICVGFVCDGLYLQENRVGVDDAKAELERPTSLSYLAYKLAKSVEALKREDVMKLYIGVYSWSVDNCDFKCEGLDDMLAEVGGRLSLAFPYPDQPLGKSLALSTLPMLPGVLGRGVNAEKPLRAMRLEEIVDALDEALGLVYDKGFSTQIADKGLRQIPDDFDVATAALELEAHLAGFVGGGVANAEKYVELLAEALEGALRAGEVSLGNPFLAIKLGHYLPYYKGSRPIVLRADAGSGFVVSVALPLRMRERLKALAERIAPLGQTTAYYTHVLAYIPRDRWPELLRILENI